MVSLLSINLVRTNDFTLIDLNDGWVEVWYHLHCYGFMINISKFVVKYYILLKGPTTTFKTFANGFPSSVIHDEGLEGYDHIHHYSFTMTISKWLAQYWQPENPITYGTF